MQTHTKYRMRIGTQEDVRRIQQFQLNWWKTKREPYQFSISPIPIWNVYKCILINAYVYKI